MKTRLLGLAAALAFLGAASPSSAAVNLITNGSFETGSFTGSPFDTLSGGSTAITGWQILGSIDWIGSYWTAADGVRSVDLSGTSLGTLSQKFATEVGQQYQVSFFLSGNRDGLPTAKEVVLEINGQSQGTFIYDNATHTAGGMQWQEYQFFFTAALDNTRLTFSSALCGDGGVCSYGAALDNVAVSAVPELSTWGMMLLGFAGIGFLTYRKTQKMKLVSA